LQYGGKANNFSVPGEMPPPSPLSLIKAEEQQMSLFLPFFLIVWRLFSLNQSLFPYFFFFVVMANRSSFSIHSKHYHLSDTSISNA
jgi:hypothetical protein